MIVLVCGLSMSGKSTLISQADLARVPAEHVKASDVLRRLDRPTVGLAANDVLINQTLLVNWLMRSLNDQSRSIVLDGHLLLETPDGPQLIPEGVLRPLPIAGAIAIHDDPSLIAKRRKGSPLTTCIQDIQDLTTIEELQARRFARVRRVEFLALWATEVAKFEAAVGRFFKKRAAG
jgi:adenylate kinase